MSDCHVSAISVSPRPLTVVLQYGEPAELDFPMQHTFEAAVIEWADRHAVLVATHPLAMSGMDADLRPLWSATLTAEQVEALRLALVAHARVVVTAPDREVILAGRVQWLDGWTGLCPPG